MGSNSIEACYNKLQYYYYYYIAIMLKSRSISEKITVIFALSLQIELFDFVFVIKGYLTFTLCLLLCAGKDREIVWVFV